MSVRSSYVGVTLATLAMLAGCNRGADAGKGPYAREVAEAMPRIEAATGLKFKSAPRVEVRTKEQVRDFFNRLGAFDHLVFTAGETLLLGELSATSVEQARHFLDLRFWGAFMAAKYGSINIEPGGSIVLSSGIAGLRPHKGWTVAASICGAVEVLTRALAVELAPIRVNAVSPGVVRTELWDNMLEEVREAMYQVTGQVLPVGRVGEAHDLAQAFLYLMHEGFSTGQVIVVDGGTVLV